MPTHQRFRCGDLIESLALRTDANTGNLYSDISDIQDIFPGAVRFKIDGVHLLFLQDVHGQRYEPKRIAYYPDDIIDVFTASQVQFPLSPSSSSSTPPSIRTEEAHDETLTNSDSLALLSNSFTQHLSTSLPSTTSLVARPILELSSIASEISHIQSQLERSTDQQSARHQQLLEQLLQMMQEQAASKQREEKMLQEQEESKAREEKMLLMQQEIIDSLIVNQQRVDAILVQNYELHEYPIPRLFVILPEAYEKWDPRSLLTERFRLYFLCECGDHYEASSEYNGSTDMARNNSMNSSPAGRIGVKSSIHLAHHEGYEISRPTDFLDRYGPYVLGMLKILKHCLTVASIVSPATQGSLDDVVKGVESMAKSTLEAVDMSIGFLEQKLEDTRALGEKSDQEDNKEESTFERLSALEGADLRRLDTFLRNKDKDKILGNLYRITNEGGHVKWVCFEHYCDTYRETAMRAFLQALQVNAGVYDPRLRKVTICLNSNTTAQDFFKRLANQAPAVTELDVALDWKVTSSDLTMLVDSLAKSNVRYLRLDLKEKYGEDRPRREVMLPGKGKYQPILSLLANRKLQGLVLCNIYHFGLRTSQLSSSSPAPASFLRSFHYLQMVKTTDEARLIGILSLCLGLVDVRLGSFNYFSEPCPSLSRAIESLSKLEILHLHYMKSKATISGENGSHSLASCPSYGIRPLKELVSIGISFDINLLEDLTRRSSAFLEILALRPAGDQNRPLNLYPVDCKALPPPLDESSPPYSIGPNEQPFSKLTHLDLRLQLTKPSMDLLAVVLPHMNLVHFGASGETKELLKYVNYATLKSIWLTGMDDQDLRPFHDAVFLPRQDHAQQQGVQYSTQMECIRLANISGIDNVALLAQAIPLKRLLLLEMGHPSQQRLMQVINLSQLQELFLFENTYDWMVETALSNREHEFCDDLVVTYGYLDHIGKQEVHLEESRGSQKTESRLARGRVQAMGMQRHFEEYSQFAFK
ncbi:hypothetical protein EC991_002921 [Linnemannia zychae]|nr:hypothetical protein EC991_002921 [Linnemannia zychae]